MTTDTRQPVVPSLYPLPEDKCQHLTRTVTPYPLRRMEWSRPTENAHITAPTFGEIEICNHCGKRLR